MLGTKKEIEQRIELYHHLLVELQQQMQDKGQEI